MARSSTSRARRGRPASMRSASHAIAPARASCSATAVSAPPDSAAGPPAAFSSGGPLAAFSAEGPSAASFALSSAGPPAASSAFSSAGPPAGDSSFASPPAAKARTTSTTLVAGTSTNPAA